MTKRLLVIISFAAVVAFSFYIDWAFRANAG